MKLLLIEDDTEILAYLCKGLEQHGHSIDRATNGKDGLFLATTQAYDVLLIDRMLPVIDGLTIIRTLRSSDVQTPVMILSALGNVDARVKGLRAGGDDYLVKPFAFSELLARIEVLARRQINAKSTTTKHFVDNLELDMLARRVTRDGKIIDLQAREFSLLEYLLQHKGQIVTRTMLLEHVWDYNFDPQTNVIDVHISRLRSKLNQHGGRDIITTLRGTGYRIDDTI